MSDITITTQKQLRASFWRNHSRLMQHAGWTQNQYSCDVRMAWCDYVESMRRDGCISIALAERATL